MTQIGAHVDRPAISRNGPISLPLGLQSQRIAHCRLHLFSGRQNYQVLEFGEVTGPDPVLVRIESACTFAHLYGSLLCDCQPQLHRAIELLADSGRGLLVYALDQHGRGVGLTSHVQVYEKEQSGLDTVHAHESLGLPVDARRYDEIVEILRAFNLREIELLTNNLRRIDVLREAGLRVTRRPHESELDLFNCRELMVKKEKLGHKFSFKSDREWIESLQAMGAPDKARSGYTWSMIVVMNFNEEFARASGYAEVIEDALHEAMEPLLADPRPVSVYLTSNRPIASTAPPLSLECLGAIATRARVILGCGECTAGTSAEFLRLPHDIREFKLV